MSKRTCSFPECGKPVKGHGYCEGHYRQLRAGETLRTLQKHRPRGSAPDQCSIDGCIRPVKSRGWCPAHYKRWQKWGDPKVKHTDVSAVERFWEKVRVTDSCWVWQARLDRTGYGYFGSPKGYSNLAHRFAYQALVGPVSDELSLDHLCRNPSCVNPLHLEPVTPLENMRRGLSHRLINGMDDSFRCGHKFTPENTYVNPNRPRDRRCIKCQRARDGGRSR